MKIYQTDVAGMIGFLKAKKVCRSSIKSHEDCYDRFHTFLQEQKLNWCNDAVDLWLVELSIACGHSTCGSCRNSLNPELYRTVTCILSGRLTTDWVVYLCVQNWMTFSPHTQITIPKNVYD